MNRWRRGGAGRKPGFASTAGVAGRMAAVSALAMACALVLAGCIGPVPKPTPECGAPFDGEDPAQQKLQDRLETYGLWSWTWENPPGAFDLTHPVPVPFGFDPRRKIWLTTILLAPGVSGRVSIVKPEGARLFVSPSWDRMAHLSALQLRLGAVRSVELTGCDGVASYPGLTIVDGPECVVFSVQREGENRVAQVSVPFFGAEC